MTSVPGVESYRYDAAGRRVEKQPVSGSPTYSFYDQAGQLMYQYDLGTGTATDFIYLGTKLVGDSTVVQLLPPGGIGFGANPVIDGTTVSWGGVAAASSYTLQQSSNGGSTWSTVYTGSATSTTVAGLAGGAYVYRVQACASGSCSGWTTSATLGVWPTIPTVTVPSGTINGPYIVSWTVAAGASGYTVQESLNGGAWSTIATNTTATSLSRPGSTTGSYTYRVEANDAYGTAGWSPASAAVSVDTAYGVVPTPVPTLTVPAASDDGSATVSWTAASPVTGYTLQQSSDGGSTWSTVYSGTATSTTVTGLANGSYTYQIQACNNPPDGSVCTAWATGGSMNVLLPPPTPASITVPATSDGPITISWAASATATKYVLYQAINGGDWQLAYSGSATSVTVQASTSGNYNYWVAATNASGWSGVYKASSTVVVTLPPASAPSLSAPASSATGSYAVSWGGVATATSYTLQLSIDSSGWSTVQSGSATSWSASGQATGTYGYRVQACNASGCGPWSGTGTTNVLLPPGSAPSLSVPASNHTGAYAVSWGAVATASSYTLQEQVNGGGWSTKQSGSATSWSTSGKANGNYGYRVQACNASGCGPWSGTGTVTVTLIPPTPTGLQATITVWSLNGANDVPSSTSQVGALSAQASAVPMARPYAYTLSASWNASSGASSYDLQYCKTGGTCTTTTTSAASVSEISIALGGYAVNVRACNSAGCSAWSSSVTPTTVQD